jgi:4-amino-4-deoxy-L-arabinose transferase-like glycosyltransferase
MLSRPAAQTGVLLLLASLLLFAKLGQGHLANYDDCYYAQKAKEMVESGDWLTPHFAGRARFDNPPLFLWLMAGMFALFGVSDFNAIFLSALSGVLCVGLLHRIALRLVSPSVAFLSAFVLLATQYFTKYARHAMFDVFLTLLFLIGIYAYLRARGGSPRWYLLLGAACGLGVLTKSVLGFFPLAVAGMHLLWTRSGREDLSPWFLGGVGLAFLVFLPWYVREYALFGERFLGEHLRWLIWERAFEIGNEDQTWGSRLGYFRDLGRLYWPWLPVAAYGMVREGIGAFRRRDSTARLLLLWFVVVVGVMSLANEKKLWYVMPVFPGLALVCGRALEPLVRGERRARAVRLGIVVLGLAAAAVLYLTPVRLSRDRQPDLHALALATREVVPEGGRVVNWNCPYWGVVNLFLYYSDRQLTRPVSDPDVFRAHMRHGEYGLLPRSEYERVFAGEFVVVLERGEWLLIRGGPDASEPGGSDASRNLQGDPQQELEVRAVGEPQLHLQEERIAADELALDPANEIEADLDLAVVAQEVDVLVPVYVVDPESPSGVRGPGVAGPREHVVHFRVHGDQEQMISETHLDVRSHPEVRSEGRESPSHAEEGLVGVDRETGPGLERAGVGGGGEKEQNRKSQC